MRRWVRPPGGHATDANPRAYTRTGAHGYQLTVDPAAIDVVLHWSPGGDTRSFDLPGLRVGPVLHTEARGLLMRADHPLASRTSVSLEDVADYRLLDPGKALNPIVRDLWTPPVTPSGRPVPRAYVPVITEVSKDS